MATILTLINFIFGLYSEKFFFFWPYVLRDIPAFNGF